MMPPQPPQSPPGQCELILYPISHVVNCVAAPNILSDLQSLSESRNTAVRPLERARAEQLIRTPQFLYWLQSPASSQLLVHGHYKTRGSSSGLSFVCLSLANVLARRSDHFIPLTFFCGMHKGNQLSDPVTGAGALIGSLIHQLVGQISRFIGSVVVLSQEALECARTGDLQALTYTFASLISLVPPSVTVCCMVDGAIYYERDEFWSGMAQVLDTLLELSAQTFPMRACFKLLITSPSTTFNLREWFPEELIVSMANRASAHTQPSIDRVEREIAPALHLGVEEDVMDSP